MNPRVLSISLLLLAAFVFSGAHAKGIDCTPSRFQNEFQGPLEHICPDGSALSSFESCYVSDGNADPTMVQYDRLWLWDCKAISAVRQQDCSAVEFITHFLSEGNAFRDPSIVYQCPPNYFLGGISSSYNSDGLDRDWSVSCCAVEGWCQRDCFLTETFTGLATDIYYDVPEGDKNKVVYALVGLFSRYDATTQDREWKFMVCKFSLCDFDVIIERKDIPLSKE